MQQLVNGPPLEMKTRQRVRVEDKQMVGVGRYIQAGQGLGKYRSEMLLSLGDSRCAVVQVNDGHLAWSSQKTGDQTKVWRVNVLRLDELAPIASGQIAPRLKVVGLVELLDALARDYDLELARGRLNGEAVHIARGPLSLAAQRRLLAARVGATQLPDYLPDHVVIVLSTQPEPIPLLPLRIEYWRGDPEKKAHTTDGLAVRVGLLEMPETRVLPEVDPGRFEFAADQIPEYEDRTAEYVSRLAFVTQPSGSIQR